MDYFALFADGSEETMLLKNKTFTRMLSQGLHIHKIKGYHVATLVATI